eukprot:2193757-Amphidinium_carterae.1
MILVLEVRVVGLESTSCQNCAADVQPHHLFRCHSILWFPLRAVRSNAGGQAPPAQWVASIQYVPC